MIFAPVSASKVYDSFPNLLFALIGGTHFQGHIVLRSWKHGYRLNVTIGRRVQIDILHHLENKRISYYSYTSP